MSKQRICSKCGKEGDFAPSEAKRRFGGGYCRPCKRLHNKDWRLRNPERAKQAPREWMQRKRKEVLEAYGNKCACCGESQPEFLALDHIKNNGAEERRQLGSQWWYVAIKRNFPDDYQLLCHNCNMAKSIYKICPHQRKK